METINEIIAEMRRGMIPKHRHDRELLLNYADRIEKAAKDERTSAYIKGLREGVKDFMERTKRSMNSIMKTYGIKEEDK